MISIAELNPSVPIVTFWVISDSKESHLSLISCAGRPCEDRLLGSSTTSYCYHLRAPCAWGAAQRFCKEGDVHATCTVHYYPIG